MTTGATGQLGLALPVQGELSGTWGNTVNNAITEYTNIAIAATLTLTNDGAVTLANTTGTDLATNIVSSLTGAGTVTAQFAIVRVTGTLTTAKVVTAPSYSKTYTVVNAATGGIVTFKASGQTGVSIAVGESAFVYYNGTDYVKVSSTVATGVTSFQTSLSGLTPSTSTTGAVTLAGTLGTANGGTGLTSFTSGGVVYASSSSALATGSGLVFDGTNLGIGATSAGNRLQVSNGGANGLEVDPTVASGTESKILSINRVTSAYTPLRYDATSHKFLLSGGEQMRLDSTGLGIGTSSPATKLEVTASAPEVRISSSNAGQTSGSSVGTLSFYTSDATTPGGAGVAASIETISTTSNGSDYALILSKREGSGGGSNFINLGTSSSGAISFGTNTSGSATERARFSAAGGFSVGTTADPGAGAIYATGNITAYYSDARLKTVSGKIENALDKVAQLSGVYYTNNSVAKSFGYDSDEVQVGVLAQEVEAVMPEIVKAAPFDLDENGNSKSGENYKTVQYERLVPLLIEAINELQAKVKALESK